MNLPKASQIGNANAPEPQSGVTAVAASCRLYRYAMLARIKYLPQLTFPAFDLRSIPSTQPDETDIRLLRSHSAVRDEHRFQKFFSENLANPERPLPAAEEPRTPLRVYLLPFAMRRYPPPSTARRPSLRRRNEGSSGREKSVVFSSSNPAANRTSSHGTRNASTGSGGGISIPLIRSSPQTSVASWQSRVATSGNPVYRSRCGKPMK